MILTTTPTIEGRTIVEYRGVVFGEVISGVNFLRDFAASIRNVLGGRSGSFGFLAGSYGRLVHPEAARETPRRSKNANRYFFIGRPFIRA